jgi:hypothetical protein
MFTAPPPRSDPPLALEVLYCGRSSEVRRIELRKALFDLFDFLAQ